MPGWLLYPFTLGLVAAVNPCGFPLLPVYLSLFVEGNDGSQLSATSKVLRGLSAGVYATVGFVIVFGALGIVAAEGLRSAADLSEQWAHYPMAVLGVLLVVYGVATLTGRTLNFHLPVVRPGLATRRPLVIGLFGISYAIASLGCSLPLFLGGVAGSFSHAGILRSAEVFLAYSVGMGLLFTIVALVMSVTGVTTARRFRVLSPIVRPLGGLLLIVVGLYLSVYWITVIVSPLSTNPASTFVNSVERTIATYLQEHASMLGEVFGVVLLAGLLILLLLTRPFQRQEKTSS